MNDQLCTSLALRASAANGVVDAILAISLAQADVVCGDLMMRSFSLNENFALPAEEDGEGRQVEDSKMGVERKLCCRSQDEDGDTLIYWQDALWIFNCDLEWCRKSTKEMAYIKEMEMERGKEGLDKDCFEGPSARNPVRIKLNQQGFS